MWWATGTPAAVDAAAARGIGLISGRPADVAGSTVVDDLAHLELMRVVADEVAPALDLAMASRRHLSPLASV